MNPQERKVIDDLFDKLRDAEQRSGPREPTAEAHIGARIERQPGAPYLMAQTIVVQEQALEAAQSRIAGLEEELNRRPAGGGGGFLSSLFGGGGSQPEPSRPARQASDESRRTLQAGAGSRVAGPGMTPGRGGGFLAGAAQTAMGVAGGLLLGNLIGSAFGGGEAQAAEPAAAVEPEPAATDEVADNSAGDEADFGGGDFGGDEI